MAFTYVAIATVTVGSGGAANIEFTSIPATYTDLLLKMSLRDAQTTGVESVDIVLKFNGSSSGYYMRSIYGSGSSAGSASSSNAAGLWGMYDSTDSTTANTFSNNEIYIPNYTSSNYKSVSQDGAGENNATTVYMSLMAGLWQNTAAITSIAITQYNSNNWKQYSSATLYGIKNTV